MKKFALITFLVAVIFSISVHEGEAKDFWVENDGNVELYIMDESIKPYIKGDYRRFTVSVKYVKNNRLLKVVDWNFYKDNWWYYKPNEPSIDNYTPVTPKSRMFELCMKKLGWSYRIIDNVGLARYV